MNTEQQLPEVKVYVYGPAWGFPDISPFVTKVLFYLKIQGFPFTTEVSSPRKAPRGKLPHVEVNGTSISDSSQIIKHLEALHHLPMDSWLSPDQRAVSYAAQGMLEGQQYFIGLCARWQYEDGFATYRPILLEYFKKLGVPSFLGPLIAGKTRKAVIQQAMLQGAGRMTREEHQETTHSNLEALDIILGDKPYMLGDRPCLLDCSVGAFMALSLIEDFQHVIAQEYRKFPRLQNYGRRMHQLYLQP